MQSFKLKGLEKSLREKDLKVSDFAQNAKIVSVHDIKKGKTITYPTIRSASKAVGCCVSTFRKYRKTSGAYKGRYLIG